MEGVRPEKPEGAARLGFTENLWEILEQCWLEDRSGRPSVEDFLPSLHDAALHWDARTAALGNDGNGQTFIQVEDQTQFSAQTGPPTEAGGGGQGNRDQNNFPSQQPTSTSLGPPSTCRLNGCSEPVLVDKIANNTSEYCSQRHRE